MRIIVTLIFAAAVAAAGFQPNSSDKPVTKLTIDKLLILSSTLPDQDRLSLQQSFKQKSFNLNLDELQQRITQTARDLGYFHVEVSKPELSSRNRTNYDVTVRIAEGSRYHLGPIHFKNVTAFSEAQIESIFAIHTGDLVCPTKIGNGLEALREVYGTKGYIDFVAVPVVMFDESAHTIGITLDVNEGSVFQLGNLFLEGYEVHAGAAKALQESWAPLRGERYDTRVLDRWLQANQKNCLGCIRTRNMSLQPPNLSLKTVDVLLSLQQPN